MTPLPVDPALPAAFAPGGALRASINLGNPVLAGRDPASGEPAGVSVDLAGELTRRLGLPLELVVFDGAAASVEAVRADRADVGFFAVDPARSAGVHFTAPYVLIEGSYLVAADSELTAGEQVDRTGTRIAVSRGSAYDLFLTRTIEQAELVRLDGAAGAVEALRTGTVEVVAGIRPMLEREAEGAPELRMIPGRFMVIRQAMGMPAGRDAAAHALLTAFAEEMKTEGVVAAAMRRHGIDGASVAQLA
jgi:polar amino acid transport system substrate-binding protein